MKRAMKENKGMAPPHMRINRHVVGMYEWVMADVAKEVRRGRGCDLGYNWKA
jgi:hypothetical protein